MFGTLTISEPGRPERSVELTRTTSVGRTGENDIALETEGVSRRHTLLLTRPDGVILVDLGSTNGTFVNGAQVLPQQQRRLAHGDVVTIGRATLRYSAPRAEAPPARVPPPEVAARVPPRPAPPRPAPPRPRRPPHLYGGPPGGDPGRYLRYLPPLFQADDLLDRLLRGFEDVLGPLERTIGDLDAYADPRLAPEELLPWLAFWVGLTLDPRWPEERRRAMIGEAVALYAWRGTKRGLSRALQLACGVEAEIVERPDGQPHVFRVVLRAADAAAVDVALAQAVVEAQKPAHTAYTIDVAVASAPAP